MTPMKSSLSRLIGYSMNKVIPLTMRAQARSLVIVLEHAGMGVEADELEKIVHAYETIIEQLLKDNNDDN